MDSQEAEDVVKLIFGDHPPDDWRNNPEFVQYLSELGNLGADRLAVEPESVKHQLKSVQESTQELAFSNYKTFIQTSNCSKEIYTELTSTEEHLGKLTSTMPEFLSKCEEFKARAGEISSHRKMTSLTLSKHTMLLEILELPQLMDTVVRNQHYDEALELHSYVTKLWKKQPDVKILEDINKNVNNSVKLMLQQLLAQLRTAIQLPQCLKVISYLRRLEIFKENELRLKFLQARETWLHSVINAVPRDDAYIHLTRTMEVMRVHLFDIVTQYRAIFSDDVFNMEEKEQVECNSRLLFSSWLSRKICEFMKILEKDLEVTTGSIETLLGQAMYFGLSFSRVGFDFRPVLVPVFERIILKQFNKQVNMEVSKQVISDSFLSLNLQKVAGLKHQPQNQDDVSQPPMLLLDYPPLAQACNIILSGLNTIRLCAPVSCVHSVTQTVQQFLISLTAHVLNFHNTNQAAWNNTQMEGFQKFCSVYRSILLPYLQGCISAVFSPKHMAEISGLSLADLRTKNLGFVNFDTICQPIQHFITIETGPKAIEESESTSYVAERMAELTIAVQSPGHTSPPDPEMNGGEPKPDQKDPTNDTAVTDSKDENVSEKNVEQKVAENIDSTTENVINVDNGATNVDADSKDVAAATENVDADQENPEEKSEDLEVQEASSDVTAEPKED